MIQGELFPTEEHAEEEKLSWLKLASKFAADGNPKGMRACAQELDKIAAGDIDALAVKAEAALYSGRIDEAEELALAVLNKKPNHLRGRMVKAGLAAVEFRLDEEIWLLVDLVEELVKKNKALDEDDPAYSIYRQMLRRARGWLADAFYLAGEPKGAARELLARSELSDTLEEAAEIYSKYVFMRNYRDMSPEETKNIAAAYNDMLSVTPYKHENILSLVNRKLRIGYISPDFREHAVAYFLAPLLKDFDVDRFMVFCYQIGRKDDVTAKLRSRLVTWRDMRGRIPQKIARAIAEDKLDILVDLSGHSQDNALPVMAYRPAPVQISAIGYTNTTGLSAIDYFLSDEICLPQGDDLAESFFTEKIIRLPHSHLCYSPDIIKKMPPISGEAPVHRNGYVTYGSFNNFAKVTDEMLLLWRGILERVPDSKLIIKGKIASIPSGEKLLCKRLASLNFELSRVELRPFSANYLEEYHDIDIALDTAPYNGGLTTCEALYMGVPVISMRGRTHGARYGASILTNAGVAELLVENDLNYVHRAVKIGQSPELIGAYHSGLRANIRKSPLMNSRQYMQEIETGYEKIWREFYSSQQLVIK